MGERPCKSPHGMISKYREMKIAMQTNGIRQSLQDVLHRVEEASRKASRKQVRICEGHCVLTSARVTVKVWASEERRTYCTAKTGRSEQDQTSRGCEGSL